MLTTLFSTHEYSPLKPLVKIPVAYGEKLDEEVKMYMGTRLKSAEISGGNFRALWEPCAPGMQIGDVGSFDNAGEFIPLLNIRCSQEEHEARFGRLNLEGFERLKYDLKETKYRAGIRLWGPTKRAFRVHGSSEKGPHFLIDAREHCLVIDRKATSGVALIIPGPSTFRRSVGLKRPANNGYFTSQALGWYRCARDRGWTVTNGELVLISACILGEGWGSVSYNGAPIRQKLMATFAVEEDGNYYWDFPKDLDLEGLSPRTHKHRELQCVAFNAYTIHCEGESWKTAFGST